MTDWIEVTISGGFERQGRIDRTLLNQAEIRSITKEYDGIANVRDYDAEAKEKGKWIDTPKEWYHYIFFWVSSGYYQGGNIYVYTEKEIHIPCMVEMMNGTKFAIEERYELLVPHLLSKLGGYDNDDA